MVILQAIMLPKSSFSFCSLKVDPSSLAFSPFSSLNRPFNLSVRTCARRDSVSFSPLHRGRIAQPMPCFAVSKKSDSEAGPQSGSNPEAKRGTRARRSNAEEPRKEEENPEKGFPTTIPRKPRRGRRGEAAAVEDYIRDTLERTFKSIREQHSDAFEKAGKILKDRVDDEMDGSNNDEEDSDDEDGDEMGRVKGKKQKMVVEEESLDWPLDADVGWGTSASDYFEKHAIKNVVGDDGVEIDWEGEMDDNWVNEINCLEWEKFAFHPSPLVVLVFERYNRATRNWKTLQELEKAAEVYRKAKDRLPPRTVKIDINIEKDLAYALKVKECPQILFLRGNKILYREKEFRTAEELVQMIAHFYYKARRPACVDRAAILAPY